MNYIYLNDLLDNYPGKTFLEINDILRSQGIDNKMIKIKVPCKICGCEVITTPGSYRKQKSFACEEHIKHKPHGKDSAFYNRIKTNCSCCGKEIEVTPYHLKKTNSFGDCHCFCSQECYWKFRSEYYRGKKGVMYQHQYTEEQRDNVLRGLAKRFKSVDFTDTKVQLMINDILDDLHINYHREYPIDYYSCDNFLVDYNLIIEVMGDYWHASPLKYNSNGRLMNHIQEKTILKDKQKRGYISKHYNYPILNLWETDIEKYPEKCKELILMFINNHGSMENYHSFNYSYDNHELTLNSQLIMSYQDMSADQYKHLIKEVS
jgi:very-short-patch-repair endonuclease